MSNVQLNISVKTASDSESGTRGHIAQIHPRTHYRAEDKHLQLLEQILNRLPAGVVVIDRNGHVLLCNPTASELLGEPLIGGLWRDIITRAFRPRFDDGHDVSLNDGRRVSIDTRALGQGFGQLMLIKDVTETRRLQDRLNNQDRLACLGEMMASLAHQIRTPLATALLYASSLEQTGLTPEKQHKFTAKMLERLQHLERLIKHMLLFARGGSFARSIISLDSLLQELRLVMDHPLSEAGGNMTIINGAPHAQVYGNQEALLTALQNLACNALQACPERCQLTLHLLPADNAYDLTLTDTGPGIKPELQERIFEPFFTTRSQGTGLGLAVVQAIANAHEGAIWVDSRPGDGCRFTLRLPKLSVLAERSVLNSQILEQA